MFVRDIGEFGLIDRLRAIVSRPDESVWISMGDDAAVVQYGRPVVLTTDALVEGVHFREDWIDYVSLGYKSMAASISDVAAMGARPLHALITLAIREDAEVEPLIDLYRGIAEAGETFCVSVVGGDVVRTTGPLLISVTMTGELMGERPLLRSGAQIGDVIFVTGDIGGAGAYVHAMSHTSVGCLAADDWAVLQLRHRRPVPQVAAADLLSTVISCSSLNDISDGLASELHEIASASHVHLAVFEERLPTPPSVRHYARLCGVPASDFALYGGEDYQLVGTVARVEAGRFLASMQARGIRVTLIGRVEDGESGVELLSETGRIDLPKKGFDHFGGPRSGEQHE